MSSQLTSKVPQKRGGVHDEPDGLKAATVGKLCRDSGIDVDTHGWNRCGQQVASGYGMEGRGDEQGQPDARDGCTHRRLRRD